MFLLGFFIGTLTGVLISSLLVAGKQDNDE